MKQLKNEYYAITIFNGLMDFINEYKKSFPTKQELKQHVEFSDGVFIYDGTFNDEWKHFITYCINTLHIDKFNEKIKLHFISDAFFIYEIKIYNNNSLIGIYEIY